MNSSEVFSVVVDSIARVSFPEGGTMIPLPTVDVLDSITIPVACPVPWDEMHGDDRTRFCDKCSQNVHDVSELTAAEAVQLVSGTDKLPCLRLYRRPDGRVMTADCMTRRERAWKWLHRRSPRLAWLFALVFFVGCGKSVEPECIAGVPIYHGPEATPVEQAAMSIAEGVAGKAASHR